MVVATIDSGVAADVDQGSEVRLLSASHILIQHEETDRAAKEITRSKEQALELAWDLTRRARAGEDFGRLADDYTDGPRSQCNRGGALGIFTPARMPQAFAEATMALGLGGISDPVETEFGYHIIQRKIVVSTRHIVIAHQGSMRASADVARTRSEALELCQELMLRARSGERFASLATQYSDGPSRFVGGDVGPFAKGRMDHVAPLFPYSIPAVEQAVFDLGLGETSGIIESPFGCHVLQRYE